MKLPFSPIARALSVADVLARLTVDEEAAIARASADTPAGSPTARLAQARNRVLLRRLNAKGSVALDDAELVAFLQGAQADGLLTAGRITEILS